MSNIKFDLSHFLSKNPEVTKEELIAAIEAAPKVIGLTDFDVYEYLMEENRTNREYEAPDEDELLTLLPAIMDYLRQALISWESIDEAYMHIISQ